MQDYRLSKLFLRLTGFLVLLCAIAIAALPQSILTREPRLTTWIGLALFLGVAAALFALASLIGRTAVISPEVSSALSRLQQQVVEMQVKLNDLDNTVEHGLRAPIELPPMKDYSPQLEKLTSAIEQVRELSLLPDADRKTRIDAHRRERKAMQLKEVFGLVAAQDWSRCERMLIGLETEFPNDDEVARGRSYLNHSRKLFEADTVRASKLRIEELMSAGAWPQVLEQTRTLVQGFPHNGEVRQLAGVVEREYTIHRETIVQRMFEEIRHDIDRRLWRRALAHAQRLIQEFPQHRLTDSIFDQLPTLRENAEIEERQELEFRIQDHIRSGHFNEAIELAEDLTRRYPFSPQAESLEKLLPRIRELAAENKAVQPSGTVE